MKTCFLNASRGCTEQCQAFVPNEDQSKNCRLLNVFDRLAAPLARPVPPTAPPKVRT